MAYELTETGKGKVNSFITECAMRSKVKDAGAVETETKDSPQRTVSCPIWIAEPEWIARGIIMVYGT